MIKNQEKKFHRFFGSQWGGQFGIMGGRLGGSRQKFKNPLGGAISTDLVENWYGVSKQKDSTYVCDLYVFEHANRPNRPTTQPAYQLKSEKLAKL